MCTLPIASSCYVLDDLLQVGFAYVIWSTIYVQSFQESCHVRDDAPLSVFHTFDTRRKLFMHPTVVLVMWRKLNMFVGHLWLRFTIVGKARQVSFSYLLYSFLTLHITAFIKSVCDICVILENQLTDLALIVCRVHPYWMSVSCQGKWVDCPSQSGIDGTNFWGREATWWRMPFYMDLTWDMVLYLSLWFLVYFRLICIQFLMSCHRVTDTTLSLFQTSDIRSKLCLHITILGVIWRKVNMCVGLLLLFASLRSSGVKAMTPWGEMPQTDFFFF